MSDTARPPAAELLLDNFATVIGQTMGWPPMAGLTAGVLLLSAEPMTVQELQDELGASAGSVSEMTRLLIANGVVRRFKASGTRHFVYEWRPDAWAGCLEHQLRQTERLRDLAHDAVEQGRTFDEPQRRRLQAMADYYDFMVTRLDSLLEVYRGEL